MNDGRHRARRERAAAMTKGRAATPAARGAGRSASTGKSRRQVRACWPLLLLSLGCSESIEWRAMWLGDIRLSMSMPCRPASHARRLNLLGKDIEMTMYACKSDGTLFSVGTFDAGDPALVGPMMRALTAAARGNLQGRLAVDEAAEIPGMTPNDASRRQRIVGQLPDGTHAASQLVVFSYGTRVYQAIALDVPPDAARSSPFFDGLKVLP